MYWLFDSFFLLYEKDWMSFLTFITENENFYTTFSDNDFCPQRYTRTISSCAGCDRWRQSQPKLTQLNFNSAAIHVFCNFDEHVIILANLVVIHDEPRFVLLINLSLSKWWIHLSIWQTYAVIIREMRLKFFSVTITYCSAFVHTFLEIQCALPFPPSTSSWCDLLWCNPAYCVPSIGQTYVMC
jgi:hypothetical protein